MDELISMQEAIYALDSEMVSTNPDHFKSSEKFIKFMDDEDIASFGKWQWANGFNTALLATKIQLEKLPAVQPEQKWIPCYEEQPKGMGSYMTTIDYGEYGVVSGQRYYYGQNLWNDDCVIAWMPLPDPWK